MAGKERMGTGKPTRLGEEVNQVKNVKSLTRSHCRRSPVWYATIFVLTLAKLTSATRSRCLSMTLQVAV